MKFDLDRRAAAVVQPLEGRRLLSAGYPLSTFGSGGAITLGPSGSTADSRTSATAVVVEADQGIVVGTADAHLVKFNARGDLDTAFGTNGFVTIDTGGGTASPLGGPLVELADGDLLTANYGPDAAGGGAVVVDRYTPGGTLDTTFGTGGMAVVPRPTGSTFQDGTEYPSAMALGPDGTIYVAVQAQDGVSATGTGGQVQFALGIVSAAGAAEGTLHVYPYGSDPTETSESYADAIAFADGRVVLGGYANGDVGTDPQVGLLLGVTTSGTIDPTFGTGGHAVINPEATATVGGLAAEPDGGLIVAGSAGATVDPAAVESAVVARYTTGGEPDASFGTGGLVVTADPLGPAAGERSYAPVAYTAAVVASDGTVLVGGSSRGQLAVVRYSSAGSVLATNAAPATPGEPPLLYPGGSSITALAIDGTTLVAAGSIGKAAALTQTQLGLFRFDADLTPDPTLSAAFTGLTETANGSLGVTLLTEQTNPPTAVGSDGKVVVLGQGASELTGGVLYAARLNADGSFDPTFNPALSEPASAVAIQADGKVLVTGGSTAGVVRLNVDGSVDGSFQTPATVLSGAFAIDVLADAGVLVATPTALYRFDADGAADATFGTDGVATPGAGLVAAAVGSDGSTYALDTAGLVKLTVDGRLDPAFGTGGLVAAVAGGTGVAVQSSGRVLVADVAGEVVVAYTPAGAVDPTFGDGGTAAVKSTFNTPGPGGSGITLQADGKPLLYGGDVGRLTADGATDATFGSNGVTLPLNSGPATVAAAAGNIIVAAAAVNAAPGSPVPVTLRAFDAGPLQTPGSTAFAELTGAPRSASATATDTVAPTPFASAVYYAAAGLTDGVAQLWRFDGTLAGNAPVTLADGGDLTGVTDLLAGPDALYIAAGNAIYRTDGTAAPTVLPLPAGHAWTLFGATAGHLFLVDMTDPAVPSLWVTDGTTTAEVPYTFSGPLTSRPVLADTAAMGSTLYFADPDGRLVRTDGTAAGTAVVQTDPNGVGGLTVVGPTVYFADEFSSEATGRVYATDGTAAGTRTLLAAAGFATAVPVGDELLFGAEPDVPGGGAEPGTLVLDLYATDGTPAGTVDLTTAASGGLPTVAGTPVAVSDSLALFAAVPAADGSIAIYATDGTPAGTVLIHTFTDATDVLIVANGTGGAYLLPELADGGGITPYVTNGTAVGTTPVDMASGGAALPADADVYVTPTIVDTPEPPSSGPAQTIPGQVVALLTVPGPATRSPTPTPTSTNTAGLTLTVAKSALPTLLVDGAKLQRSVTVDIDNATGAALKGTGTVDLYATDAAGTVTLVGIVRRSLKLASGKTMALTIAGKAIVLPAGSYTVVPTLTIGSDTSTAATGPSITVAPPTVTLTAAVTGVSPATVAAGRTVTITLALTNTGNVNSTGAETAAVTLTAAGTGAIVTLSVMPVHATVKFGGRPVIVKLKVKVPLGTAAAAYDPTVVFTQPLGSATAVGTTPFTVG